METVAGAERTAAERADARRQRILAKKSARMAYAAGDRSVRPREAAVEPIAAPPARPASAPVSASGPAAATGTAARPWAGGGGWRPLAALAPLPAAARPLAMAVVAVALAWMLVAGEGRGEGPVSAVLVFLQMEGLLHLPALVALGGRLIGGGGGDSGGLPQLVRVASSGYARMTAAKEDAVVFGFTYLAAVRLARAVAGRGGPATVYSAAQLH